jgi:hypothetical protein
MSFNILKKGVRMCAVCLMCAGGNAHSNCSFACRQVVCHDAPVKNFMTLNVLWLAVSHVCVQEAMRLAFVGVCRVSAAGNVHVAVRDGRLLIVGSLPVHHVYAGGDAHPSC